MEGTSPIAPSAESPSRLWLERLEPFRLLLWLLAGFGLFVLNGVYLYFTFARPEVASAAMSNPVSLVFMTEAFVLMVLGAWLIARAGLRRPGWGVFIVLSIAGSLIFSIPAFLLLHMRKRRA